MTRDEMIEKWDNYRLRYPDAWSRERAVIDEFLADLAALRAPAVTGEVYPNSDRGLREMCPGVPVSILRGIQEAAFRAGREDMFTAQVAAPPVAEAPPADEHVVGYTPDGTPLMKVVNINAAGNTDVGVYAMPQLKREPAPPAVAGGDVPEIQVGDEVYYQSNTGLRLHNQQAVDNAHDSDDPIIRVERNGVVIWRRRQEGQ